MSLFVIVAFVISMAQGPHLEISRVAFATPEACDMAAVEVREGYEMEGSKAFVDCLLLPGEDA